VNRHGHESVRIRDPLTTRNFVAFPNDRHGRFADVLGKWDDQQWRERELMNGQPTRFVL
jgi:hypothetical protein